MKFLETQELCCFRSNRTRFNDVKSGDFAIPPTFPDWMPENFDTRNRPPTLTETYLL
jgi:hypothetical protein